MVNAKLAPVVLEILLAGISSVKTSSFLIQAKVFFKDLHSITVGKQLSMETMMYSILKYKCA